MNFTINQNGLPVIAKETRDENRLSELLDLIAQSLYDKRRIVAKGAILSYPDMQESGVMVFKIGVIKIPIKDSLKEEDWLIRVTTRISEEEFSKEETMEALLSLGYKYILKKVVNSSIYALLESNSKEKEINGK